MNDKQKSLQRTMDEYEDLFDELPPLYCVTAWSRDRDNVYADLRVLARKAAKKSLNIEPLCIGDYFFKHRSETDANLPEFLALDPFTNSFYNVGIFFFIESENYDAHQIMRSKSSGIFRPNAASIEERRSSLQKPLSKFSQFATAIYPQLVNLNPFPFFPLLDESQPRRLGHWKLALLLMRLSLESPEQFGVPDNFIGLGGGLPSNLHEQAIEKLKNGLRPKYAQGFPNVVVTMEDMVSRLRPSGVVKPREGWPMESASGELVWQQPTIISVVRQDILKQADFIIRKVASSPDGTVSLPQETEDAENIFLKDGKQFHIRFRGGKAFNLEDSVGLGYIRARLMNQGRPFTTDELMTYGAKPKRLEDLYDAITDSDSELKSGKGEGHRDSSTHNKPLSTKQRKEASESYKELLLELETADPDRAAEIEKLMEITRKHFHLKKNGDLGRQRTEATSPQRRTESVSKAIKKALQKIKESDPDLADYLSPLARYSNGVFDIHPERIEWMTDYT